MGKVIGKRLITRPYFPIQNYKATLQVIYNKDIVDFVQDFATNFNKHNLKK